MRSTGEMFLTALSRVTLSNRRRYGGYIVHIGVLLIALGIYYSSFYESEGTIVAKPGGFAVIEDRLTGQKLLVVYEGNQRSSSWDATQEFFARDPERAKIYANMLRHVRMNPEMSAQQIIDKVVADARREFGNELPPIFTSGLPRMQAAIHWGVAQRERQVVYEDFNTTLHAYPYTPPDELDIEPYMQAHDKLQRLLHERPATMDDRQVGRLLMMPLLRLLLEEPAGFREALAAERERIASAPAEQFANYPGLREIVAGLNEAGIERARGMFTRSLDGFMAALDEQAAQGVLLGAELPELHKIMRHELSELSAADFADKFGLDASAPDFAARRFSEMAELEKFHLVVEAAAAERRNEIVHALALKLPDKRAQATLEQMRPLTLAGLRAALAKAKDETATAITTEIAETTKGAATVHPRMRIFYDKRTGAPKTAEPIKDPEYHRTLSRDAYFILQDVKTDGTGTFRFFVKPQMVLGLAGLAVVVVGTVMAFLPSVRRRRT
jgi:hypothetical protein